MANVKTALDAEICITNSSTSNVGGETTLNDSGGISATDTTIIVSDGSKFTAGQTFKIGSEYIKIGTIDSNTFSNCLRAQHNSTATSHNDSSPVYGVFIGVGELNSHPDITISMKCDTTGQLYIQTSDDGTNWNTTPSESNLVIANHHKFYKISKCNRYFRVRFENNDPDGFSEQTTYFRLNTYHGVFYSDFIYNGVSELNSFNETLSVSEDKLGTWEQISKYATITILASITNSQNATLYAQFSTDATTITRNIQLSSGTDTNLGLHNLIVISKYFRIRVLDAGGGAAIDIQTIYHKNSKIAIPTSRLDQEVNGYTDVINSRSVIVAADSNNNYGNLQRDDENSLLVNITGPLGPFGTLISDRLYPTIQRKFINGTNEYLDIIIEHDGASASATTGELICSTSTTTSSILQYTSKKISRYRPGQGVIVRFTARFGTPVAGTTALIGIGTPNNGLFVGYDGEEFGFLKRSGGSQEIRKLQITSGADGNGGTFTITLNGTTSSAITLNASDSIGEVIKEIYDADIFNTISGGWHKYMYGDCIYFVAISTETRGGSYSLNDVDSGVAGTFSQSLAASSPTETWVAQTEWNRDNGDNTATLPLLDFTKGNVFQIFYQWLGYGPIVLQIENPSTGKFVNCHKIEYGNSQTTPSLKNPDLPFMIECDNKDTSSNIQIICASLASFIVGEPGIVNSISHSIIQEFLSSTDVFLALRYNIIINSIKNQNTLNITGLTFGNESSNKVSKFQIIKNCGLVGPITSWTSITGSLVEYNTQATDYTNGQIIFSTLVSPESGVVRDLSTNTIEILVHPGDIILIKGSISTSAVLQIGISYFEEH